MQRFVRVQYEAQPYKVLKYAQNEWVDLMDYQSLPINHILNLWISLNKQTVCVITKIPEDRKLNKCEIDEEKMVTLEWLIQDYLDHMEIILSNYFT